MDYLDLNREAWNNKVETHLSSSFYDVEGFLNGKSSLNSIELGLLGNLEGKSLVHLQCHFGLDSMSLSRMGAEVTGIDLSNEAIKVANSLNQKTKTNTTFFCTDVYNTPKHITNPVDVVFTSYGTIGWLPDVNQWAKVISKLLKPGGHFVFVEFHPVLWMFDDTFSSLKYSYFNSGPIIEEETGTYADKDAPIQQKSVGWNHSLDEVCSSLLDHQLEIISFSEYDYSPYPCFERMVESEPGKYQIQGLEGKLPMIYALKARKKHSGLKTNSFE